LLDRENQRKSGDLIESNQVKDILENDPLILFRSIKKSMDKT
jgi:hypothetical protein